MRLTNFREWRNEDLSESKKINTRTFKKLLDKYGYTEDPEEISFALDVEKLATMGSIEEIVEELNELGMTVGVIEKKLKTAIEGY